MRKSSTLVGAALFPVVELDLVWRGGSFPGFEKRLQAQQKDPPLGAAMVHELHRLLPTLVFKEDDGPVAFLPEVPTYFCTDPFFGPVDHLPQHVLGGMKLKNLHVESAVAKAEFKLATDFAFPLRVVRPRGGKTFVRGQCLIDIVQGRRFDSDFVQNVHHVRFLLPSCWLFYKLPSRPSLRRAFAQLGPSMPTTTHVNGGYLSPFAIRRTWRRSCRQPSSSLHSYS